MTRTQILTRYGIVDRPDLIIQATKEDDVLWLVKIQGQGDPVRALATDNALKLSQDLRRIGERTLAGRIVLEAERAHRSNVTGS
jgi:hypothetical protein